MFLLSISLPGEKCPNKDFLMPLNDAATFIASHLDLAAKRLMPPDSETPADCGKFNYSVFCSGVINEHLQDFLDQSNCVINYCETRGFYFFLLFDGNVYCHRKNPTFVESNLPTLLDDGCWDAEIAWIASNVMNPSVDTLVLQEKSSGKLFIALLSSQW